MDLLAATFAALMRMTPHKTDTESRSERSARMHVIAESINDATLRASCSGRYASPTCKPIYSDRRSLAALLLGKGHFESDFAEYVHEGRCSEGPVGARCDSDKQGHPRAHGPWQQWELAVFPREDWQKLEGATPEATSLAAWHAAKLLAGSRSMCKAAYNGDEIQAAIAGFSGACTMRMKPEKIAYQAQAVRKILATLPAE
jgi:hypothetical protein